MTAHAAETTGVHGITAAGAALTTAANVGAQRNALTIAALTNANTATGGFDNLCTGWTTVASASSIDLSTTAVQVEITGTTTITEILTGAAGRLRVLRFGGSLTLTHNASTLVLPGAANIQTAAGDVAIFSSTASNRARCIAYLRAGTAPWNGSALGHALSGSANAAAARGTLEVKRYRDIRGAQWEAGDSGFEADDAAEVPAGFASEVVSAALLLTDGTDRIAGDATVYVAKVSAGGSETALGTISLDDEAFVLDSTLTGWVKSLAANDTLRFVPTAVPTVGKRLTVTLNVEEA